MRKHWQKAVAVFGMAMISPALALANCSLGHGGYGYGTGHCGGFSFKIALFLVTLALGWWILKSAKGEDKNITLLGKVIGWAIMFISAGSILCTAACKVWMFKCSSGGMMGKPSGMFCPVKPEMGGPVQPSQPSDAPAQQAPASPHKPR